MERWRHRFEYLDYLVVLALVAGVGSSTFGVVDVELRKIRMRTDIEHARL